MDLPVIVTERLILRPVEIGDAEAIFGYCSDVETIKFLSFPVHQTVEDTRKVIQTYYLPRPSLGLPPAYAIVIQASNEMIGTCDFHTVTKDSGEIGFVISRNHWNHGYTTEACLALIKTGFSLLDYHRISIRHHQDNLSSKRVIEKCGFVFEGIQRKAKRNKDGVIVICCVTAY